MILLEKLNKIEGSIADQNAMLTRFRGAASLLTPDYTPDCSNALTPPAITPCKITTESIEFCVPTGHWGSVDTFCSLPSIRSLAPTMSNLDSLLYELSEHVESESKSPNLNKDHTQKLFQQYIIDLHPLHPVVDLEALERVKERVDEEGLRWTGEDALFLTVLALGCILCKESPLEYVQAAKRRLGFALEQIDLVAIQTLFLQGIYWHLLCRPVSAARGFHHAASTAYFYFTTKQKDRAPTDLEKNLFWECLKMETRYSVDVQLPASGLASLDLVTTELPEKFVNNSPHRLDLFLAMFELRVLNLLYGSAEVDSGQLSGLSDIQKDVDEWYSVLRSSIDDTHSTVVHSYLEFGYQSLNLLVHRPFLQTVLSKIHSNDDIQTIPNELLVPAHAAIKISVRLVSMARRQPVADWLMICTVLIASLLVASASSLNDDKVLSKDKVSQTLEGAMEFFARAARDSEAATRALRLISMVMLKNTD